MNDIPDITKLPIEIQSEIFSQDPELLLKSLQLTKNYNQILERNALKILCDIPFNVKEFRNYLNNNPTMFALYAYNSFINRESDEDYDFERELPYTISANLYIRNTEDKWKLINFNTSLETTIGLFEYTPFHYDYLTRQIINNIYNDNAQLFSDIDGAFDGDFDLLTYYRLCLARVKCMNLNPQYAKDETIKYFKALINDFNQKDLPSIVNLYCWLVPHIWILNLNISLIIGYSSFTINPENISRGDVNPDHYPEYDKMKKQNKMLVDFISQKVNHIEFFA